MTKSYVTLLTIAGWANKLITKLAELQEQLTLESDDKA
jgi:hypothetical protein